MNARQYTTTAQIDSRFVWLDSQIAIIAGKLASPKACDREKLTSKLANLKHSKKVLAKRRDFLLTPELL